MKQLIEYIVSNLVNHPEDVVIEETSSEDGLITIIINVNPDDVGRVIGRAGKVIKAIRQIARIAAIQKGLRVNVDLKQDENSPRNQSSTPAVDTQTNSKETDNEASGTEQLEEVKDQVEVEPVPTLE